MYIIVRELYITHEHYTGSIHDTYLLILSQHWPIGWAFEKGKCTFYFTFRVDPIEEVSSVYSRKQRKFVRGSSIIN